MDRRSHHVRGFVEMLLGPVIYLGFFGLTYLANSLICTLSHGNTPMITDTQAAVNVSVLGLTIAAIVLIGWHLINGFRLVARGREDREDAFMGLVSLTLAMLSALAVLWTALPAATLPPTC